MATMGSGAADGLKDVIAQMFLKAQAEQQAKHQAAQMANQSRGLDLEGQRIDVTRDRNARDAFEFDTTRNDTIASAEAKAAQAAAEAKSMEDFEATMPEHLRQAFHASGHKHNFSPDQFVNAPLTYTQQDERNLTNKTAESKIIEGREMRLIGARPQPQRDERLVQIAGPNGSAIWVKESDAVGQPAAQAARSVTGQERGVLAFYNRAKDASETIASTDKSGKSLEDRVATMGLGGQLGLQYAPNMLQNADQQAYRQAQRAFTEARLRKESGAAIPTAEYENDSKTYFAQPGDTPQTVAQKRAARQQVLDGLKFSSGRAYDEFYGGQNTGGGAAPAAAVEYDFVPGKGLVPRSR